MIDTTSSLSDVVTRMRAVNGQLHVHRVQDVEPYLDDNKRMQADQSGGWRRASKGNMRKIASIPNIVVEKWLQEGFNAYTADPKELRKKLDDPDYAYLKTVPGKIGRRNR